MDSKLCYDVLYRISQFLDDRTRMNLALANRSTYDMIRRVHLRENLVKLQGEWNSVIFVPGYAYPWAIRYNKVSLLEEIFESAGDDMLRQLTTRFEPDIVCDTYEDAKALRRKWDIPTSFFRRTISDSLYSGHTAALEILMRRIPDVLSKELVFWADSWLDNATRLGHAKLLRILHEAGFPNMEWQGDGYADELTEMARYTRYGAVFRVLIDMGADRSPLTTFMDGATLFHERAMEGKGDEDLFSAFLENGMDLNGVAITLRLPVGNPDGDPERFGFTPLELACQFKNLETVKILLSLGADYAGSVQSSSLQSESYESANSDWEPTTPLHALFETPERYNNSEAPEVWDHPEGCEKTKYIYLTEHRLPKDLLCKSFIPMIGGVDKCRPLKLMENLVAYAEVHLRGVKMLVAHDLKDYINTEVQDLGTPLESFLAYAAKMRLHHDVLAEQRPPKIDHDCPLEAFYGRVPLDEVLGRTCDLLLDAGADIPFENYEAGKDERGSVRLQRLLSLRWLKKLASSHQSRSKANGGCDWRGIDFGIKNG